MVTAHEHRRWCDLETGLTVPAMWSWVCAKHGQTTEWLLCAGCRLRGSTTASEAEAWCDPSRSYLAKARWLELSVLPWACCCGVISYNVLTE